MPDNSSPSQRSSHGRERTEVAIPLALLILIVALALAACIGPTPGPGPTPDPVQTHTKTPNREPPRTEIPPQTTIPDELVGQWNGGPDPGEYWLTLTKDGRYELSNARYDYFDRGFVALQLETMIFTSDLTGKRQDRQWTFHTSPELYGYTFSTLSLDGYSYVRES